jgi:O-acetyl-ADP-ribose deacetylase (regulator of RNase III)
MKDIFKIKHGNILNAVDIDAILHQANIHHTMGGGIARFIRWTYPEAYKADCKTPLGDTNKLGTFSWARVYNQNNKDQTFIIYNCYSQANFGRENGVRYTDYDAVEQCFNAVKADLEQKFIYRSKQIVLAIPYGYGCGLGGGDWNIVKAIINKVFADGTVSVEVYQLN